MIEWKNLRNWVAEADNETERFLMKHKENVFIYGAGIAGYWYLKFLRSKNVNVAGFIVSNIDTIDRKTVPGGLEVFSLRDVISEYDNNYSIVIGAPKFKSEIENNCYKYCKRENIFSFEGEIYYSFIHDIEKYRAFLLSNWNRIEALYNELADIKSKNTLQAFIMGRVSGNQDFFIDSMVPNQYYPEDIVHFSDDEVMVECGANNGETMLEFVDRVKGLYKHIYLFEPDRDCIKTIRSLIREKEIKNIDLLEKGAWNKQTVLKFTGDSNYGSGHVSNDGDDKIDTETIDASVSIPPSYIKMDIEGAELMALQGGGETIKRYTPKLAICVYHNMEDFIDIPEFIKKTGCKYNFYLRHHNWGATETVMYFIPK